MAPNLKKMEKQLLLKVLVGSRAHGLATAESDYDYRGVYIVPTDELLKLGASPKTTQWIEGEVDDTSWELGHFLKMATQCNPTILETFLAPIVEHSPQHAWDLRGLFPHLLDSKRIVDAFIGYGLNQRKKFLENKNDRPKKYAVAYLRTLFQAEELLRTGTFTVRVVDTEVGPMLKRWKEEEAPAGEVIQECINWEMKVMKAFEESEPLVPNLELVNEFLLKVRKSNFNQ